MYDLTSPKIIRYLSDKYHFKFNKGFGQNFLTDADVLHEISRAAGDGGILEIGPGIGTLTAVLATDAQKVVSVEIDQNLLPILDETLAGFSNIKIISGDIMKTDIPKLIKEEFGDMQVSVAANLPYYITTPIIMGLLEQKLPLQNIVVMIQKEVAERIVATPGGKEYGALSVAVQYYTEPSIIASVPAESFVPQPKVDSSVVLMRLLEKPRVAVNEKHFFSLVKAAFSQRRKTLLNAVSSAPYMNVGKDVLKDALNELNINENIRGEALSIEQFAKLSNLIENNPLQK